MRMRLVHYFENQRNQNTAGDYSPLRMRPFHEIPWQLMQSGQHEELKNFLVQPSVISCMMDSYNIDSVKSLIVEAWCRISRSTGRHSSSGYEPRAELLQSIPVHRSTVEEVGQDPCCGCPAPGSINTRSSPKVC